MIKAVIFDSFKTLVTEYGNAKITSKVIMQSLGIPYNNYRNIMYEIKTKRYRGKYTKFKDALKYLHSRINFLYDIDKIKEIA